MASALSEAERLEERFWAKVAVRGPTDCWLWTAFKNPKGYGQFGVRSDSTGLWSMQLAHRVSYELHYGPLVDGQCALHKCDTPPCVNWAHLYAGTIADNNADKVKKNRHARGERLALGKRGVCNPSAKLTEEQVREILCSIDSCRLCALRFGVSSALVSAIRRRENWKHVEVGA